MLHIQDLLGHLSFLHHHHLLLLVFSYRACQHHHPRSRCQPRRYHRPHRAQVRAAGGHIVKPAQDTFYGGYAGYFQDPDGNLWEAAWNPQILPDDAA